MHAPEEHSDTLLRRLRKTEIPQQQFPVKRVPLAPERRAEDGTIWFVTRGHESLKVMSGDELVMDRGAREIDVVAAHAHHLLLVRQPVGRKRDQNRFAAEKERTDELSFRRHHFHPPRFFREFGHGYEIVIFDKLDRFESE